jgi:uncharacterized membrane protein YgaE (UPF0421/DUF939 family)
MLAATGLAVAVGYAIAPNRWFWPFFAAFAVMAAANTAAEHVRAAIERAVGTACGVAVGVVAAHAFERQPVLSFGLLFAARASRSTSSARRSGSTPSPSP